MGVTEVESGVLTLPWFEGAVCVEFLSELFGTTAGIDVGNLSSPMFHFVVLSLPVGRS